MPKLSLQLLAVLAVIPSLSLGQPSKSEGSCDSSLWKFVYHPSRLPAKNDCRVVTGRIKNFKSEADGDYHIRLTVTDKSLVNAANVKEQSGTLVVEPVCQHKPTQSDAIAPCSGYSGPKFNMTEFCPGAPGTPPPPPSGKEGKVYTCKNPPLVEITGFYTIDNDHGWMELHTVNGIKVATPVK